MGRLEITESGIRLDGAAEFVGPLYAQNISTEVCGATPPSPDVIYIHRVGLHCACSLKTTSV